MTTGEAGRAHQGLSDDDQLRFATAERRVLVTEDHDFVRLAATRQPHAGIVCFPVQLSIGASIAYLELVRAHAAAAERWRRFRQFQIRGVPTTTEEMLSPAYQSIRGAHELL